MDSWQLIGRELIYASIDLILFEQIAAKDAALAQKDAALAQKDADLQKNARELSEVIKKKQKKINAVHMPNDPKKREVFVIFRHHEKHLIVAMRRQRAYTAHRRKELEASGFVAGEAMCDAPNSRYTWADFQRELLKAGALVRQTTPNARKPGSNINSMHITQGFDLQRIVDKMGCSEEEGEWLRAFIPFDGVPKNQRTLNDSMVPRRKHACPSE
jgi:hypothetical protein